MRRSNKMLLNVCINLFDCRGLALKSHNTANMCVHHRTICEVISFRPFGYSVDSVGWFVVVHKTFLESSKSKNIINLMSHYDESRRQTTEGTQLFSRLGNMNCLQSNNYENEYWIKILKVHLVIWFHLRKFSIVFNYGMDNNELVRNKNVLFVINDRHLPEIIRSLNVDPKTLIFLFQSARKMI